MGDNRDVSSQVNTDNSQQSRLIVLDFVNYKLHQKAGHQRIAPLNSHHNLAKPASALRNIGDEFEHKYRTHLDDMFVTLQLSENTARDTFFDIVNELFNEGVTWGRIVALFAFTGDLAVRCVNGGISIDVEQITSYLNSYIEQNLQVWINEHGGWNGFVEYYDLEGDRDAAWFGLKKIICGVAAGAVGALTIGAFLASKS